MSTDNSKPQKFDLSDLGKLITKEDPEILQSEQEGVEESEELDNSNRVESDSAGPPDRENPRVQSGSSGDRPAETTYRSVKEEKRIMDHQPLKLDAMSSLVNKAMGLVEKFYEVNRKKTSTLRPSSDYLKSTIGAYADLVLFCVKNPNPPVLDVLLDLYKKEHKNLLSDMYALQGAAKLPPDTRRMVEMIHAVFSMIASKEANRRTIDLEVIREKSKSDDLVNYLSSRI